MKEAIVDSEWSGSESNVDLYSICMEICCQVVAKKFKPIGGPGLTVEIGDSNFGPKEYRSGTIIEDVWVLGGICRENNECFLVQVPSRDTNTLMQIILKHVLPGTKIVTRCLKTYCSSSDPDFDHLKVNHNINFMDPETRTGTQKLVSTWSQLKRKLPYTHQVKNEQIHLYLGKYLWNKIVKRKKVHPFEYFLKCLSKLGIC
ncbi:hypothetical protein RF11_14952 [Thelohanellus kitauei]|uniref:ISXO2-like transposase domain-containing protein n=1 Tax=Thelohanellus kitauei TaxID=669202 RepID=A0A0C2NA51_THEKT|nr:hypothetical protein RF11_14952 [Thelohanellus kitauei]